ncbi:MAG: recombinase family protein [Rhodopila sp.]
MPASPPEQQATDSTINSQIAALEVRLAQDGLSLMPNERFCDEGYSGATLVRPALERLRDAVAAGHVDRLGSVASLLCLIGPGKRKAWRGSDKRCGSDGISPSKAGSSPPR